MFDRWPFQSPGTRWQRKVLQQLSHLDGVLARGLATRLEDLNQAVLSGDARLVARQCSELEGFLQATRTASALLPQVQAALEQPGAVPDAAGAAVPGVPEPAAPQPAPATGTYWISSATIAQAHAFLTQKLPDSGPEPEWMLAVTGLCQGNVRTLEHLVEVRLGSQSRGQASFDIQDFTRVAVLLHEHGQALHAIFHSHRSAGPPRPSWIDERLQAILEDGGYPAIQAVFSEDGYVRFFAGRRHFAIDVHGKGVRPVDGNNRLYRIVHFGALPHPAPAAPRLGRGNGLRSLPTHPGR
jgi:hypothetical protein